MEWIKVQHPDSGSEATVAASALREMTRAGWVPSQAPETPEDEQPKRQAAHRRTRAHPEQHEGQEET